MHKPLKAYLNHADSCEELMNSHKFTNMRKPRNILIATILLIALIAAAQFGGVLKRTGLTGDSVRTTCADVSQSPHLQPMQQDADASLSSWQDSEASNPENLARASLAVEAEVVQIDQGASVSKTPYQEVSMAVCDVLVGNGNKEIRNGLTVVKAGDELRHVVHDPFYTIGERYVLYLVKSSTHKGAWTVVDTAGRHLILADGVAEPTAG